MNEKTNNKIKDKTQTIIFLTIALSALLFLNACASAPAEDNGKLNIVTTIGMIADITQNVGGEHVKITGLGTRH